MNMSEDIVRAARGWIGTPYRHQAALKTVGCDCLGLVRGVWREIYGSEPEATPAYTADWAESTRGETLRDAARRHMQEIAVADAVAGDLLLFRWKKHLPAKHAGVLSADHMMIHAQDGYAVSEVALSDWWQRRVAYAFRFPEKERN